MRAKVLVGTWLLAGLTAAAFAAGPGYRTNYDYAGRGDDWYGATKPDPRRHFPANLVELASDGEDFGRGYNPLVVSPGAVPPLARTDGPGSAYIFFHGSLLAEPGVDCDLNGVPDICDLDCGPPGGGCDLPGCGSAADCNADTVPDACQLSGDDCDGNGVPDSCELAAAAAGCPFPSTLVDNGTSDQDATFLGPPDDVYYGVGGQIVTWEVGCGVLVDGPGSDFTLYEVASGSPEFDAVDVLASSDGAVFVSVKATERNATNIPGDDAHGNNRFARSYDLQGSGLSKARYVRVDGVGTGSSGSSTGFDLDALGFVHVASSDCDTSGVLDACEVVPDCNSNGVPEACELSLGAIDDCDVNGTADTCDTLGGIDDCDGDTVPDSCEADCNANLTPDDCDILDATSGDCNVNGIPDECDLAATQVWVGPSGETGTAQLVFSEDFETPDTGNYITYNAGESIVTASAVWSVTTSGVDLYEAPARAEAAAYDGTQAVDLTGSPGAGVIETSISTVPGQAYELVFHYARNDLLGAETGDAQVWVEGTAPLLQANIQHDPAIHPFDHYLEFRRVFVADSAQATLRFVSLDPDNTGITLDGIALSSLFPASSTIPLGVGIGGMFVAVAPFAAASDVTAVMTASTDLGASNEYIDLEVNTVPLVRFFETTGLQCLESAEVATIPAESFNDAVAGGSATVGFVTPASVNGFECADSYGSVSFAYAPVVDCNGNGTLDQCDISSAASTDVNLNGIADECEPDCNGNTIPDSWDTSQGTAPDCNGNGVPDTCDVDSAFSDDCDTNGVPDECQPDCNGNFVADNCDIASTSSDDCDLNGIPDECDIADGPVGCVFPQLLLDNGTNVSDDVFLGAPDLTFYGLGGQIVTFEFDCGFVIDGPGGDFNIYEVSSGGPEFSSIADVLVSADGVDFVSVVATEAPMVRIPGDEAHTNDAFGRSYDIFGTGLNAVRFVRIDGAGTGASGSSSGFDLDAVGAVNRAGLDCDASGVPDICESFADCNDNGFPDSCELALGVVGDCDMNGVADSCDIVGGDPDVDSDWIPDGCEPDCDADLVPDHYQIEQGTSSDCNDNGIPDACDLASATSPDCNGDMIPDECAVCPTVEVVFIMDTSSSMSDEGSALCANLQQVVAELQADLVNVETDLLGILSTGSSTFSCLTDTVGNLYGTAVPGNPPAGQEVLGEPCNANLNEDWGLATAIVAGLRPWQTDSVRLIVPVGDEGPRCGDPVNDPGDDRDSINHAIGQAVMNGVIVSPIAGSGSSGPVVAMADLISGATGGATFQTSSPGLDLAVGIRGILEGACFVRSDCNGNSVPDSCDLAAMVSQDCDMNGRPDECEADCNGNGLHDSCDLAAMTSSDDNANAVPDECEGITLTAGPTEWSWTEVSEALGYDLVRGNLGSLLPSDGDYALATDQCLVNDHAGTTWALGADPAPGEAFWYLVRGVLGSGNLTYDGFGSGLVQGRDAGIGSSGVACP